MVLLQLLVLQFRSLCIFSFHSRKHGKTDGFYRNFHFPATEEVLFLSFDFQNKCIYPSLTVTHHIRQPIAYMLTREVLIILKQ